MIAQIATVAACLAVVFIFRRFDRANARIIKLKRFTDKTITDFKKLAEDENRKFNDSTIDMDILLKKAGSLTTNIHSSIEDLEKKLAGVQQEKNSLKIVEENLQLVANAAVDVNKQIKYIESSRSGFSDIIKKLNSLGDSIGKIEKDNAELVNNFADKIRMKSKELSDEIGQQSSKLQDVIKSKEERIIDQSNGRINILAQNFSDAIAQLEMNIAETGDGIIENVRARVDAVSKSVAAIDSKVNMTENKILGDLSVKIQALENAVDNFENSMNESRENVMAEARRDLNALNGQIDGLKLTLGDMEGTVFAEVKRESNVLKKSIDDSVISFREMKESLVKDLDQEIRGLEDKIKANMRSAEDDLGKMYSKMESVEQNINLSREKMISSFEDESEKIRNAMDELTIHSVAKRDEIIKAARKEAEEVKSISEGFKEQYAGFERVLENRFSAIEELISSAKEDLSIHSVAKRDEIIKAARKEAEEVKTICESFKEKYVGFERVLEGRFSALEERLNSAKGEIVAYEEQHRVFDMRREFEDTVRRFENIVEESKAGIETVEVFMNELEDFKEPKRILEKELKIYYAKKEKLDSVSEEIHAILDLAEDVKGKAEFLKDSSQQVDIINGKIDTLQQSYANLDARIEELREYEDIIAKNLSSIQKIEVAISSYDSRISAFNSVIDKTEKKVEKMRGLLSSVEETTMILKSRENEIKNMHEKFNEIEGLSDHLESRMNQILAMLQKMEKMHDAIDQTDSRLQDMYSKTDQKMRQLSDFLQSVGSNTSIVKQFKGDVHVDRNINDGVVKTIRELNNKGWSSEDISSKLRIDENTVRLVINTGAM